MDTNNAKLAIIELNKEFANLEESLANGDISYEEFSIRNTIRLEKIAEEQRKLALGTRDVFDKMQEHIGNAFEGMKNMVVQAFKDIAQAYVTMIVQQGLMRILGIPFGVSNAIPFVMSGPASAPIGAAFKTQNMRPSITSSVLSSGDLRISVGQANTFSKRTGV